MQMRLQQIFCAMGQPGVATTERTRSRDITASSASAIGTNESAQKNPLQTTIGTKHDANAEQSSRDEKAGHPRVWLPPSMIDVSTSLAVFVDAGCVLDRDGYRRRRRMGRPRAPGRRSSIILRFSPIARTASRWRANHLESGMRRGR